MSSFLNPAHLEKWSLWFQENEEDSFFKIILKICIKTYNTIKSFTTVVSDWSEVGLG